MDRQPWFGRLTADQRAAVLLVTQRGVANFVAWLDEPAETIRLTAEAFRIAPRDLAQRLTLRQTVELVRVATDVFEQRLPPLAADEDERRVLVEGVLRFGRGIAFAAATAYAGAAEARGTWDARLEALVVDAVVRGPGSQDPARVGEPARSAEWPRRGRIDHCDDMDALVSRAAALGWDPSRPVRVIVGTAPGPALAAEHLAELRGYGVRTGRPVLAAVQGTRLVVVRTEPADPVDAMGDSGGPDPFGPGPVVVGPRASGLTGAYASAHEALAGLRAARGRPDAPRPVAADDLLPERALGGDPAAHRRLVDSVVTPLAAAGGELLRTLAVYVEGGGALEACARALYVHPNTVRYRLRRIGEVTGHSPTDPRDSFVLRTALVVARLRDWGKPPNGVG